MLQRQHCADVHIKGAERLHQTALLVQSIEAVLEAVVVSILLKLVPKVKQLLPKHLQSGDPLLLVEEGQQVERLLQVERRADLQRNVRRWS